MRAKASDYAETEGRILWAATARLIALSACQDPLPTTEHKNALGKQCWAWAAHSLQKWITHIKDLLYLVHIYNVYYEILYTKADVMQLKRNLVNHHTGLSNAANDIVASHYKFRINTNNSNDTDGSIETFNSDLATELLNSDSFVSGVSFCIYTCKDPSNDFQ